MILRLRELREANGLEVKDMCRKLDVADSRYRKWESGTNGLPMEYAMMCCSILHCTLDELAGRVEENLTTDERELLSLYRAANDQGRAGIMALARSQVGMEGQTSRDMSA